MTLSQPPPGSSSCPSPGTIALPWLPILWGQKISMLQKSKMLKPSYSHQTIQINVHSEVFILIDVGIPGFQLETKPKKSSLASWVYHLISWLFSPISVTPMIADSDSSQKNILVVVVFYIVVLEALNKS